MKRKQGVMETLQVEAQTETSEIVPSVDNTVETKDDLEAPIIPRKCRSLRKSSVIKRLEIEMKKKLPRTKEKQSKKKNLSKYRRKSANAKERERMKKQNSVFEVLKEIVPCEKPRKGEEDKETKVTTLRSAILYIRSLKSLLSDCEAGRVDSQLLRDCALNSSSEKTGEKKKRRRREGKKTVVDPLLQARPHEQVWKPNEGREH